jgi:hypothetical protein
MTLDQLNQEVERVRGALSKLPVEERRDYFEKQINRLPRKAGQLVRSVLAASIEVSPQGYTGRLVILVHGIRTRAEWQGRLRHLFEQDGITVVEPLGYGFFDVFRFLCPFWTRQKPIDEVLVKIRDAIHQRKAENREIIFFAHSFGTYILGAILRENPDICPDRMLLCGSVLPRVYRWDKLPNRPKIVLNEAGSRDIWPILANSLSWGYGSTGTFGFQAPGVRDRFHDMGHSDYFEGKFATRFWLPWIQSGHLESTKFETKAKPPTPWLKSLLDIVHLKWLAGGLLLLWTLQKLVAR